ncbi:MAG: sulfotransferase, partial [Proteobacteria bacterium]|nr:sulfotransferase [Pseudomonadota bacterium]
HGPYISYYPNGQKKKQLINARGAVKGRYLEVRYEDLVESPEPTMRKVCAFLGEKWDPAMLKHEQADVAQSARESSTAAVSEAVHTRALDRWRKEHGDMAGKLDSAAVSLLSRLGYANTEAA